jgi:hypothetical protein
LKAIARATLASVLVLMLSGLALAQSTTPSTTPAKPPAKPAAKPASSGAAHSSDRLDGIAAVVNDDVVLESDVEEQLYLFLMRAQQRPDSSVVDTMRTQILNQLIDEKLIVAEAKRQGVSVSDAEVSKQVDDAISTPSSGWAASRDSAISSCARTRRSRSCARSTAARCRASCWRRRWCRSSCRVTR